MREGRTVRVFRGGLGLGVATLLLTFAACGGGSGATPTPPTVTPDSMFTPEPSPAVTATAPAGAPTAPPITVTDPALKPFGEATVTATLGPGQSQGFEGPELAERFGGAPPCAGYALLVSWQVRPPDAGVVLTATHMDITTELGRGPSGTASTGCAFIEVTNPGGTPVTVEVRYVVAEYNPE